MYLVILNTFKEVQKVLSSNLELFSTHRIEKLSTDHIHYLICSPVILDKRKWRSVRFIS